MSYGKREMNYPVNNSKPKFYRTECDRKEFSNNIYNYKYFYSKYEWLFTPNSSKTITANENQNELKDVKGYIRNITKPLRKSENVSSYIQIENKDAGEKRFIRNYFQGAIASVGKSTKGIKPHIDIFSKFLLSLFEKSPEHTRKDNSNKMLLETNRYNNTLIKSENNSKWNISCAITDSTKQKEGSQEVCCNKKRPNIEKHGCRGKKLFNHIVPTKEPEIVDENIEDNKLYTNANDVIKSLENSMWSLNCPFTFIELKSGKGSKDKTPEYYSQTTAITPVLRQKIPHFLKNRKECKDINFKNRDPNHAGDFSRENKEPRKGEFHRRLLAGAVAGAMARTAVAPMDYARGHFYRKNKKYTFLDAMQYISKTKKQGFLRFWRGNMLTLLAMAPQIAIQFAVHDQCKIFLDVEHKNFVSRRMLAGSIAGVSGQAVVYPLELLRIRLLGLDHEKRSFNYVLKTVWREAKLKSIYRGFFANMLTVIPLASVTFFLYDSFKRKARKCDMDLTIRLRVLFGIVAGWLGQIASTPFHTVRRQMQLTPYGTWEFRNTWATFLNMLKEDRRGHRRLRGAVNVLLNSFRGPLAVGLAFAIYDYMLQLLKVKSLL